VSVYKRDRIDQSVMKILKEHKKCANSMWENVVKRGLLQASKIFFSIVHFFECAMHTVLCKSNRRGEMPIRTLE
jgi:hypothetical protein